ncbi:MAG: hypothetical protein ACYCOY_06085 [Metallibacterium sp.]
MMERHALEQAFRAFLDAREQVPLAPDFPFRYGLVDEVKSGSWRFMRGEMIADHLRETTNLMNEWWSRLRDWNAWLAVLDAIADEQEAWRLRQDLVEPLVFWCMLRPSAMRELFGFIATHALHQANLVVDRNYRDRLDEDAKNRHLNRDQREQQLRRIGARWPGCTRFAACLTKADCKGYRDLTFDYRNLASHGMAPRFEFGHTNFVRRAAVPKSELVPQMDGSFSSEATSGMKTVRYDFGGTPPLRLREMHAANQSEFAHARAAFEAYRDLLRELQAAIRSAAAEGPYAAQQ